MKVSIIVPVYNCEAYLERCFDSIKGQTLTDWECIVIDDGSTDNSGRICDSYASEDSRFKVIHQENRGVSAARNAGLGAAAGEYVGFVDSDDWIESNMFSILYTEAIDTGSDVVVCSVCDRRSGRHREILSSKEALMTMFDPRSGMEGFSVTRLIRRSLLKSASFDENVRCYEDLIFFYHLFAHAEKVCWYDVPLYHYDESRSDSATASYLVNDNKKAGMQTLKRIADNEADPVLQNRIRGFIYSWAVDAVINYVSHGNTGCEDFIELCGMVRNREHLDVCTMRQKIWRHIILHESLRKIYWMIKGVARD